jgi:hypothetical protein
VDIRLRPMNAPTKWVVVAKLLLEAVMHLGPKVHGAREHQTGKSDEVQPC